MVNFVTQEIMNKKIEASLSEETIKKVEYLQKALGCKNKADAVARAVSIAQLIVSSRVDGDQVAFEKDGEIVAYLRIPEL